MVLLLTSANHEEIAPNTLLELTGNVPSRIPTSLVSPQNGGGGPGHGYREMQYLEHLVNE